MDDRHYSRMFYVETFLLLALFTRMILILSGVFVRSKTRSTRAKNLTDSVLIAQNVAEVSISCREPEDLPEALGTDESYMESFACEDAKRQAVFRMDEMMNVSKEGRYKVSLSWHTENGIVYADISVGNASSGDRKSVV